MNKASIIGLLAGLTAIIAGNIIEGGRISSIVQGSAALIVFGGTLGATFLSFSIRDITSAIQSLKGVFINDRLLPRELSLVSDMVEMSTMPRRNGVLSLETEIQNIRYSFFRRGLRLVIDGLDPKLLRKTLEQ